MRAGICLRVGLLLVRPALPLRASPHGARKTEKNFTQKDLVAPDFPVKLHSVFFNWAVRASCLRSLPGQAPRVQSRGHPEVTRFQLCYTGRITAETTMLGSSKNKQQAELVPVCASSNSHSGGRACSTVHSRTKTHFRFRICKFQSNLENCTFNVHDRY